MAVVLVTGMSGTGKSTVLGRLAQRGYRVVDTDFGGWIEEVPRSRPGGAGAGVSAGVGVGVGAGVRVGVGGGVERQWREDRVDALIAEHERSGEVLFISGTVWNQGRFRDRFDEVVLLSAPLSVMLERVAGRDGNPFGKAAEERDRIVADTIEVEPLLRASATVEIDTRLPLSEVVDRLMTLVGPPLSPG